jgi:hypothetical protein
MTIVNGFDKVIVSLGNECRRVRVRKSQTVLTIVPLTSARRAQQQSRREIVT